MSVQVQQKISCGHWISQNFFGKGLLELQATQSAQYRLNRARSRLDHCNQFGSRDVFEVKFRLAVALEICAAQVNTNKLVDVANQMQCQIARRVFDLGYNQPKASLVGVSLEFKHQFCQVALIEFNQVLDHVSV